MTLKDIFEDRLTMVFLVTDQSDESELHWTIEASHFELLPDDENYYFVRALQVFENKTTDCYLGIMTPERIAETVIKRTAAGQIVAESIYDQPNTIIPTVASNCFGDYNLFYAKENPQVGIDILKDGLPKASHKNIVAEDLGYILRDEQRVEEAIEAFEISVVNGPTDPHIYRELAGLYGQVGQIAKQEEYLRKYTDEGGV